MPSVRACETPMTCPFGSTTGAPEKPGSVWSEATRSGPFESGFPLDMPNDPSDAELTFSRSAVSEDDYLRERLKHIESVFDRKRNDLSCICPERRENGGAVAPLNCCRSSLAIDVHDLSGLVGLAHDICDGYNYSR